MSDRPKIQNVKPAVKMLAAKVQPLAPALGFSDNRRGSRHERGYGTAWDKLRLVILKRDKYQCQCDDCRAAKRVRTANEVDHKINKAQWLAETGSLDGVDDPANLQAMHPECHRKKTQTESRSGIPS